ncbi:hypothetical protein JCM10212_001245 [Sporobolomyces blumeae]
MVTIANPQALPLDEARRDPTRPSTSTTPHDDDDHDDDDHDDDDHALGPQMLHGLALLDSDAEGSAACDADDYLLFDSCSSQSGDVDDEDHSGATARLELLCFASWTAPNSGLARSTASSLLGSQSASVVSLLAFDEPSNALDSVESFSDPSSPVPSPQATLEEACDDFALETFEDEDDLPEPSPACSSRPRQTCNPLLPLAETTNALDVGGKLMLGLSMAPRSKRSSSPTQEEMDAFFGFVDHSPSGTEGHKPTKRTKTKSNDHALEQRLALVDDRNDTSRRDAAPPTRAPLKHDATARPKARPRQVPSTMTKYWQLEPVPTRSAGSGLPLTPDEKRAAIIASLQRSALSVLEQIVDGIASLEDAPPPRQSFEDLEITHGSNIVAGPISTASGGDEATKPRRVIEDLTLGSFPRSSRSVAAKKQTIRYPRRVGKDDKVRFGGQELACFLKVVELVLDGLVANVVSTKRDLYYRDVRLFRRQETVDSMIETLAATLRVRRSDLNVVATAKGLFSGSLVLVLSDTTRIEGSSQGSLIPPVQHIHHAEVGRARWVLVVEKDAVFQTLARSNLTSSYQTVVGQGVLITGKGYPDTSTRELVKRLGDEHPSLPICFLVDSDPYGIEILSTYVLGSSNLSHDAANLRLGFDRAQWIGVRPSQLEHLGESVAQGLLELGERDRQKAVAMSKREWFPTDWRDELECMISTNRKAEIEILSSTLPAPSARDDLENGSTTARSHSPSLVSFVLGEIRAVLAKGEQ